MLWKRVHNSKARGGCKFISPLPPLPPPPPTNTYIIILISYIYTCMYIILYKCVPAKFFERWYRVRGRSRPLAFAVAWDWSPPQATPHLDHQSPQNRDGAALVQSFVGVALGCGYAASSRRLSSAPHLSHPRCCMIAS